MSDTQAGTPIPPDEKANPESAETVKNDEPLQTGEPAPARTPVEGEGGEPPPAGGGGSQNPGGIKRFFTSPTTVRVLNHILLALGLIAFIYGLSWMFTNRAERLGEEWVANLRPGRRTVDDPSPQPLERTLPIYLQVTDGERERLQNQRNDIRKRAKHHLDVALFYYTRFYMAIMAFSVSAALAAISLAVISKRGLDRVSEYLVTMFLVMTAVALFYQSFPGVFQHEKTIEDNRALYIKYVNMEDDMLSYCVTGKVTITSSTTNISAGENTQGESRPAGTANSSQTNSTNAEAPPVLTVGQQYTVLALSPGEFIHYIDYQLKTYNDIAIGFDESKAANFAKEQFQTP